MQRRLGFVLAVLCATGIEGWPQIHVESDDSAIRIQVHEPLGRNWTQQPVAVDVPWPSNQWKPDSLQVTEADGRAVPYQLDGMKFAANGTIEKGRLFLLMNLKSDADAHYLVRAAESPARATATIEITERDETVTFKTGQFSVEFRHAKEVYDEPRFLWQVPAAFLSWTGADRIPRGEGVMGGNDECVGYDAHCVERGPIRVVYEAIYYFTENRSYRQRWTMYYGVPSLLIEEIVEPARSLLGTFSISLGKNFIPTQFFTHANDAARYGRHNELRYSEEGVLGTIEPYTMANSNLRWAGFYGDFPGSADVVVVSRRHGRDWLGSPLVIRERIQPKPDILITSPLTVERRHWMFSSIVKTFKADWPSIYPNLAAWPERYGLSFDTAIDDYVAYDDLNTVSLAAHVFATQNAFCSLDDILRENYQWDEPKDKKHPVLWNLPGGVDDLAERLQSKEGNARFAAVVANTTEAVERPGRMERESARRLERMALLAAKNQDTILAREVMEKLDYLLTRTGHDLLLFGMDYPTELDLRARGEALSIGVRIYDLLGTLSGWELDKLSKIRAWLAFWAYRMADPDCFPDTSTGDWDETQQRRLDVWNVYRYTALAEFASVFPTHPRASLWKDEAYRQLQRSLQLDVHADGTLTVSPGMASELIENWLRVALGDPESRWNLFLEPGFQKLCRSLLEQITPAMPAVSCPPGLPGVGVLGWRNEGALLMGLAAAGFADSNPSFARELQGPLRLYEAMAQVDSGTSAESIQPIPRTAVDLFLHADATIQATTAELNSRSLGNAGAVFRHYAGTDRETYVYLKAGQDGIGYDNDEGAFSFIWHGIPISLDSGTDRREDRSATPLESSSVHNVVVFGGAENVQIPTPGGVREMRGRLQLFGSRESVSAAVADLTQAARESQWLRALVLIEDRYLVIVDGWNAPQYDPIWLLHAFTDEYNDTGVGMIQASGRFGGNLQIGVFGLSTYILEQNDIPQLDFGGQKQVRIRQKTGRGGILAVLYPGDSGAEPFHIEVNDDVLTIAAKNEVTSVRWKGFGALLQRCEMPSAADGIDVRTQREGRPESQTVVPWTELK